MGGEHSVQGSMAFFTIMPSLPSASRDGLDVDPLFGRDGRNRKLDGGKPGPSGSGPSQQSAGRDQENRLGTLSQTALWAPLKDRRRATGPLQRMSGMWGFTSTQAPYILVEASQLWQQLLAYFLGRDTHVEVSGVVKCQVSC